MRTIYAHMWNYQWYFATDRFRGGNRVGAKTYWLKLLFYLFNYYFIYLTIILFIFSPIQSIGIHPRTYSAWWRWRRSWQWTLKEIHFNSSVFGSSFYSSASDILSQSGKIPLGIQLVKKWTRIKKDVVGLLKKLNDMVVVFR